MKKIKYILCVLVLGSICFTCTDQSTFRNPAVHELERGAYVRFTTVPPTSFVPELAQNVSISAELYDANNNVSLYELSMEALIVNAGETFKVDNFITISEFPATLNITSQMISDAIGVPVTDFGAGDFIKFTAVATRNDGVKFYGFEPTFNDDNGTVGLGNTEPNLLNAPAYMDAMDFDYIIACPMPEEYFVGKYEIEVLSSDAPFGPIFGSIEEVELEEKNVYQRTFEATFLLDLGIGNTDLPYDITFLCGDAYFAENQESGLTCGGSIVLTRGASTPYDDENFSDDDEIEITIFEEYPAGSPCGGSGSTVIKLTKI